MDTVNVVTIIDAKPRQVLFVLRDYARLHEVMPHMKSATVDEHQGKRWVVTYEIRGAMGIGNRDYQLEVIDDQEVVDGVEVLIARQTYTKKGDIVDARAQWTLVPINGGAATLVRYTTRTDIGGSISVGMMNRGAAAALPKVLNAIRKRAPSSPSFK